MKLALATRYKMNTAEGLNILPWLVMRTAMLLNMCNVGEDGRIAYERRRGKKFKRDLLEFGESLWYLKPGSARKDELDGRWGDTVYLGLMGESGDVSI